MNKSDIILYLAIGFVLGIIFSLVILFVTEDNNNIQRVLNGKWIKNANEKQVHEMVYTDDPKGDWVCVNILGMKYDRAVEICQHEVGHEIFAEVCEKDMDKCLGVLND